MEMIVWWEIVTNLLYHIFLLFLKMREGERERPNLETKNDLIMNDNEK